MENKIRLLFDFQKFDNNSRLAELISQTENRYGTELSDDELTQVSAAGDIFSQKLKDKNI